MQQDGVSIHTSYLTQEWFGEYNVNVIKWPAYSPDLSPMENLWGILARSVFQNGKQYATVKDLEAAVNKCWAEVSLRTIRKLIDSMPDRICAIIEKINSFFLLFVLKILSF